MKLNDMKKVAQNLGLTYDGELQYMPLSYGVMEGYTVVLFLDLFSAHSWGGTGRRGGLGQMRRLQPGGMPGQIQTAGTQGAAMAETLSYKFSIAVKSGDKVPEYADFQEICKGAPWPVRVSVKDYRLTFDLGGTARDWQKRVEQSAKYLVSALKANGYVNCDEQTGNPGETRVCFVGGGQPKLLDRESFERIKKSKEPSQACGPSLVREIGGSVLCAVLFTVLLLLFGRISGLIFWIIVAGVLNLLVELFCRICGTEKETAENPRGFRILEILMVVTVLWAERMSVVLPGYLAFHEENGMSLFYAFWHTEEMLVREGVILLWVMTGVNLLLVVLVMGVEYRLAKFRKLHNQTRILGEDRAAE